MFSKEFLKIVHGFGLLLQVFLSAYIIIILTDNDLTESILVFALSLLLAAVLITLFIFNLRLFIKHLNN